MALRSQGKKVAVVPTMGYLHEGHLSLIRKGKEFADAVITTLFVNPLQFGPNEDFEQYPRDFKRDCMLAESAGCDVMYAPEVIEMYPRGYNTNIHIGGVTDVLEGERRPGHFDGVATVVAKLFNASVPDIAVFGQKDYQQTLVIKRLNTDLNFGIDIIIAPTKREANGLAMSSRNTYLSTEQRENAGIIFRSLEEARREIAKGERERKIINSIIIKTLKSIPEIKIDYVASALADTLEQPETFLPGDKIVMLIACYFGKTRLIDNAVMEIPYALNEANFVEGI